MFFRPTRLRVDLGALEANYRIVRTLTGSSCRICAVVKANAYGLGAPAIARRLQQAGCDCFGVATMLEASELRREGITGTILLLGPIVSIDSLREALLLDVDITVHHLQTLDLLAAFPPAERTRVHLHLKLNTGMNRLGLQPDELVPFCARARELGLGLTGAFTTFSSSDQKENPRTPEQLALFRALMTVLRERGLEPKFKHAANSGGILHFPGTHLDMVRPGLLLHGISPSDRPLPNGMKPIARLETEIVQIGTFKPGTPFGYSASLRVERETRAAVLPIGYADGLSRSLSNRGQVLVRGRKAPIIGKVSMDLTAVDVTDIPDVALGDTVTIIGADGGQEIGAWEMAALAGTIPWEIFCWIAPRVHRIYEG